MIKYHLLTLIEQKSFQDRKRLTLNGICEATDLSRATLSKMLNEPGSVVSLDTIDRLCNFFKVPIEKLIEHVPEK